VAEGGPSSRSATGLLAVLAVFILGVICGAALLFAGLHLLPGPARAGLFMRHEEPLARIDRELDLDAEQRKEIHAVMERSHARINEILEQSHKEIQGLLRPDQREKFNRHVRPRRAGPPPGPEESSPGGGPPERGH
jgi:hypothetical protein